MRYVSTRGTAPVLAFDDVLLAGLARDGGLYVAEAWPKLGDGDLVRFATMSYEDIAVEVMWPYVDGTIERDEFAALVSDSYASFDSEEITPLRDLGHNHHLLELFHGPTLAFKDLALQLVGRLFDHELSKRSERVTIVGATSGDTGSAAIEACRDRDAIDIFILHPAGRVSDVQRRQMTTVDAANVHNIAIEGTFDDCQDIVKALFADEAFRDRRRLSAVNSINWARVMAQIVYYVVAAARLDATRNPIAFSVPTGNFGNVFAGYVAMRMGVPVERFVVASNRNDILTRFLTTGVMEITDVEPSLSPSMDIQVSSNLERLIFELFQRDGAAVEAFMSRFRRDGAIAFPTETMEVLGRQWIGVRLDDEATLALIRETYASTGVMLDPHSAVGYGAAIEAHLDPSISVVSLATAHPAKFPDAIEQAVGLRPELPPRLADLMDRPEHYVTLPADVVAVGDHIDQVLD